MAYGRGNAFGSGVLIVIGFLFLGRNLDLFIWSVGDVVKFAGPVVLIIFGLSMIFKPKSRRVSEEKQEDEWKAYTYGPTEHNPVPPAPPLHPDPTKQPSDEEIKRDSDKQDAGSRPGEQGPRMSVPGQTPGPQPRRPFEPYGQQSDPSANAGPYKGKHAQHMHQRRMDHWEKHALHAAKIRERIERRHLRHYERHHRRNERVEWWNHDPSVQTRSGFIGDIYLGHDYWELKPMNISHFIGDTVLDLTKAQIPSGETVINISSFIGDVKVYLPNDYEIGVHVVSSAFVGDVAVLENKEGGIFKNIDVETPFFGETDKKIRLHVSTFIGDVRVTKVG
ncbi:cell wall-active antibiotics response protein [Paenibacillus rhizovicinus]|uniref:Cell wall-active antibiotics response protein n=2 Tax=Paenibacillus rhizovicinus TaxID=2704463 RepID=A0A6C0P913_9BACL|nr:cell wall-active antibiotics response protein [Paenibacillus rhizovicinus]